MFFHENFSPEQFDNEVQLWSDTSYSEHIQKLGKYFIKKSVNDLALFAVIVIWSIFQFKSYSPSWLLNTYVALCLVGFSVCSLIAIKSTRSIWNMETVTTKTLFMQALKSILAEQRQVYRNSLFTHILTLFIPVNAYLLALFLINKSYFLFGLTVPLSVYGYYVYDSHQYLFRRICAENSFLSNTSHYGENDVE